MNRQEEIEKQKAFDSTENQHYDQVFRLLDQKPLEFLGADFPGKVVRRIIQQEKSRRRWFIMLSALGIIFSLVSTLTILTYYFGTEGLSKIMDVTGWAVFAGITIVVIQYLDRQLVRKKRLHTI
jgi:hypothetical protein